MVHGISPPCVVRVITKDGDVIDKVWNDGEVFSFTPTPIVSVYFIPERDANLTLKALDTHLNQSHQQEEKQEQHQN